MSFKGMAVFLAAAGIVAAVVMNDNDDRGVSIAQAPKPEPLAVVAGPVPTQEAASGPVSPFSTCFAAECAPGDIVVKRRALRTGTHLACKTQPAVEYLNEAVDYNAVTGGKPLTDDELRSMAVQKGYIAQPADCWEPEEGARFVVLSVQDQSLQIAVDKESEPFWAGRAMVSETQPRPDRVFHRDNSRGMPPEKLAAECATRGAFLASMVAWRDLGRPQADVIADLDEVIKAPGVAPHGLPPKRKELRAWVRMVAQRVYASDRNGVSDEYTSLQAAFTERCARNEDHYIGNTVIIDWIRVKRRELLLAELPAAQ